MNGTACAQCRTELAPAALACPACGALVHADTLKTLAAAADHAARDGDLAEARDAWTRTLALLPPHARQHEIVSRRIASLSQQIDTGASSTPRTTQEPSSDKQWWQRGAAGLVTVLIFAVSKLKFLLLGLTKASTFFSMLAFFGVYWTTYGWPLALGLVVSIYIHEMGHVSMLRRFGIGAGAPLFIPGMGAMVMLKERVRDPLTDAKIGLAGPIWGLGAAVTALAVYGVTRTPLWLAIAELTAFLNLFNLIPIWQLDGSRGFHVLARGERWAVVAAVVVALYLTEQRLLFLIGGVAVWRALQKESGPGDAGVLATFAGLVLALSVLARAVG